MKAILVNYNHSPNDWWLDYGFKPEDVSVYDRSDDGVERTFAAKTYRTKNVGNVDYDKLSWIVENYFDLPEVFLWGKTNIFKYVDPDQLRTAIDKGEYAPLCKDHPTTTDSFGVAAETRSGLYYERSDPFGWWTHVLTNQVNWSQWCEMFGIKYGEYIPFPPGGNFILTKERVQKYGVDFYEAMRNMMPYCQLPAEAAHAERSYHLLWK